MNAEDLTYIEQAGGRCGVCDSGRGWRRFEIVRAAEREPVVVCGACRARFGNDPPVGRRPTLAPEPVPVAPEPTSPPKPRAGDGQTEPGADRLRAALRELPGVFSTTAAARAAGVNRQQGPDSN